MNDPNQSFDIDGCRAMLAKLGREMELCRLNDREHLSGHLVNFAITAYHLINWTWLDLQQLPAIKEKLAAELHIPADQFSENCLFKHVVQMCPGMDVCQAIANGTKHIKFDGRRAKREVQTFVSAHPTYASSVTDGPISTGTPKVVVDGVKSGDVRDVFEKVLQWWTSFIYDHDIDRFNGPHTASR